MTTVQKQLKTALYVQPDGKGTAMQPLSLSNHGMADLVIPGPGSTPSWGQDAFGRYVVKTVSNDPPGGLPTTTLEEDECGTLSFLTKKFKRFGCFPLQRRWYKCGRIDNPLAWDYLLHMGNVTINQRTVGAGPSREKADAIMFDSYDASSQYVIDLLKHSLTGLTIDEDQNLNAIAMLSDLTIGCDECFPGYEPDTIIYVAADARSGSPGDKAELWYSTNGGGTFAAVTVDPFAAGQDILFLGMFFISDTQFRVIVVNDQAASQSKYADITLGAEGTATWSAAITIGAAAVQAWEPLFYNRIYAATAGDIYLSTNQGVSYGAAIYTGAVQINAFAKAYGGEVYAVGASNLILRERNQSSTFEALVGPAGGGAFTAVFVANDGRLYAGNGQSLYVSANGALNAGGWEALKDFGSNRVVKAINCPGGEQSLGGDSQLIRVVVDNTTPGTGEVWESEDGGNSFRQVTSTTNTGYNDAVFSSIDDNLALIVGDGGVIHKLSPTA